MFENYQSKNKVSKDDYKSLEQSLRNQLQQLQWQAAKQKKPVIVVIAGDDRSGRHETINTLSKWMDPRFLTVNAYGPSRSDDDAKPFFWRFWRDLPGAGEIAIYLRDWTSTSIVQNLNDDISDKKLKKRIQFIRSFEKGLIDDGALIIKIWLHIAKPVLKERVKEFRNTPYFDKKDELALRNYDHAIETIKGTLSQCNQKQAKWKVIDGSHERTRDVAVAQHLIKNIGQWLDLNQNNESGCKNAKLNKGSFSRLKMPEEDHAITGNTYKNKLEKLQSKFRQQMFDLQKRNLPVVIAFEGWDAAGKGGAIRRLVAPLDAGFYRIRPIAKPTEEEYAHHYLWRFWKQIPRNGHMTIFDRSWYGRVLVERIEGFASINEWSRAFNEINSFEAQLHQHGCLVIKFWLNISNEEQLRRFQEREVTPHKKFKITEEDYRNRDRWEDYTLAIEDMIENTSTQNCPWHIISSNHKNNARLQVLETCVKSIKRHLKSY